MKIKVFIVIDHLGTGGAQQQVMEYLKYADQSRYAITVVSLDPTKNFIGDNIKNFRYEVISIAHHGFFNPSTIQKLVQLFKKEKPDIVHTYLFTSDTYGRLSAKLAGVKHIICSIRNNDLWKKPQHIFIDRILAKFTSAITINAESMRTFLVQKEKIVPDKITRIYNGLDLRRFDHLNNPKDLKKIFQIPSNALIVGMVARFSDQKDQKTFLEAAKMITEKNEAIYFLVIGDGSSRKAFEAQYKSSHIIFTGLSKDTPNMINIFDIGVLSTHYEGCPNVVLEYMACFKPVVATNVDGCPELVLEGETGFLVPESRPEIMAEKLRILLKNKDLREQMGKRGRERVEKNFTSQILAKNTEGLYKKLLEIYPR